jgi:hypothetical protein
MIRQATKKPITIEFIQFTGLNNVEISEWVGQPLKIELESETAYVAGVAPPIFSLTIPTLEGDMKAMPGDYIIKGIKGEFYPCKPDIFKASYDFAAEAPKDVPILYLKASNIDMAQLARTEVIIKTSPELPIDWQMLRQKFLTETTNSSYPRLKEEEDAVFAWLEQTDLYVHDNKMIIAPNDERSVATDAK